MKQPIHIQIHMKCILHIYFGEIDQFQRKKSVWNWVATKCDCFFSLSRTVIVIICFNPIYTCIVTLHDFWDRIFFGAPCKSNM